MIENENKNEILIYQSDEGDIKVDVHMVDESVWLSQAQMGQLFGKNKRTISEHLSNIFNEGELVKDSVIRNFRTTAADGKNYYVNYYNLDVIISVGYRVKSLQGTNFRQWATKRLKDYLIQGYAINEERLKQKDHKIETLKTGLRIINRSMEEEMDKQGSAMLKLFSKGLELLDDYDHEELDIKGNTKKEVLYPTVEDYLNLINEMQSDFQSGVFAKPKDDSFNSSVNQIRQQFSGQDTD